MPCWKNGNSTWISPRYLKVLKPMHEQFIEPSKKYADIIIPLGGENKTGINIIKTYIEKVVR